MDTRMIQWLRILIAGLVVSAGVALAVMADDAATINQRLAALGLHVCAVNPASGGAYHLQIGRTAPGTPPAGGPRPGQCPFSIDARFEGRVLVLDKEGLGRAGLVFPLLPPGVKIASLPSGPQLLHPTGAMPPTDLNTMQHSLEHAKAMKTEALGKLDALKQTAAQVDAILAFCPVPDLGLIQPALPSFPAAAIDSSEPHGTPGSCEAYVQKVTFREGSCSEHLQSINSSVNEADTIKKYAADSCASGGLTPSDKQSLKSVLDSAQVQAAGDASQMDALIVRIQQLINEYLACIKSK